MDQNIGIRYVTGLQKRAKFAYQSPIALEKESAETINSQITFHYKKKNSLKRNSKIRFILYHQIRKVT